MILWGLVKFFQAGILYQGESEAWLGVSLLGLAAVAAGSILILKR